MNKSKSINIWRSGVIVQRYGFIFNGLVGIYTLYDSFVGRLYVIHFTFILPCRYTYNFRILYSYFIYFILYRWALVYYIYNKHNMYTYIYTHRGP